MADTIFQPGDARYLDRVIGSSQGVRRVEGAKLFFPEEMPELIEKEAKWSYAVCEQRGGIRTRGRSNEAQWGFVFSPLVRD
jgi:hypothetical protein